MCAITSLGVVTVSRPIDYETDETLTIVVAAGDDGQPPLSATATVVIDVQNENDESPVFQNVSQVSHWCFRTCRR